MKLVTPLNEAQLACIDLLREALKEAEGGSIHSVGIIACMKGGYASVMAGTAAADLNLGCDDLKRKILDAVSELPMRSSRIAAKPAWKVS